MERRPHPRKQLPTAATLRPGPGPRRSRQAAASTGTSTRATGSLLAAESAYAQSIVQYALGDVAESIESLRRSYAALPTYAPAILGLGSVEYQLGRRAKGRKLLFSLLDLPEETLDLCEIVDQAGDFLIQSGRYAEGLSLYRLAAARFPRYAIFHQGIGCCAGHQNLHDEAVAASREAVRLEPQNQKFVNDLGWTLHQAGQTEEALTTLERAAAMDAGDELAAENLRICRSSLKASPRRRPARKRGEKALRRAGPSGIVRGTRGRGS